MILHSVARKWTGWRKDQLLGELSVWRGVYHYHWDRHICLASYKRKTILQSSDRSYCDVMLVLCLPKQKNVLFTLLEMATIDPSKCPIRGLITSGLVSVVFIECIVGLRMLSNNCCMFCPSWCPLYPFLDFLPSGSMFLATRTSLSVSCETHALASRLWV